jgi:hypothetical protein
MYGWRDYTINTAQKPSLRKLVVSLKVSIPMTLSKTISRVEGMANTIWVLIGPGTLSILAIIIMATGSSYLSIPSIAFLLMLVIVAIARWLDPVNSVGTAVAVRQRLFYVVLIISLGIAGWIGTHLVRIS